MADCRWFITVMMVCEARIEGVNECVCICILIEDKGNYNYPFNRGMMDKVGSNDIITLH